MIELNHLEQYKENDRSDLSLPLSPTSAEFVNLRPSRVRDYPAKLVTGDIVVAEGSSWNSTYRLKG